MAVAGRERCWQRPVRLNHPSRHKFATPDADLDALQPAMQIADSAPPAVQRSSAQQLIACCPLLPVTAWL